MKNKTITKNNYREALSEYAKYRKQVKSILEKLQRQFETNNIDAARILISHCLEKVNKGEPL